MANISTASNVLAPRYLMRCTSKDCASKALATELHLRREEKRRGNTPTPPSQAEVGSGAQACGRNQSRTAWGHARTVLAQCSSGVGIRSAAQNRHLALAGKAVTSTCAKASDRVTAAPGNANARTVSAACQEARHALA